MYYEYLLQTELLQSCNDHVDGYKIVKLLPCIATPEKSVGTVLDKTRYQHIHDLIIAT